MKFLTTFFTSLALLSSNHLILAETTMLVPITPALSTDGSSLIFSWENDLWKISTDPKNTAYAERLTIHPGKEYNPIISPDEKTIYFNSNREGSTQVFSMPINKPSESKQITFHSVSNLIEDLADDGQKILYRSARDIAGRNPYRIYQASVTADQPEQILFDASALNAKISPDGNQILFTREGEKPYRTGYYGSKSSQIWLYEKTTNTFTQPVTDPHGCLSPLWLPDGSGFYYVNGETGKFNLFKHDFATNKDTQLTRHSNGNVMFPVISKDGTTIIYRHLFHFYKFDTKSNKSDKLTLKHNLSLHSVETINIASKKTDDADFSASGLEIAFTNNGNIFAMDTILREPIQLTDTPEYEKNIYFGDKGRAIYYISDDGIKTSINKLTKSDPSKYWWETESIKTTSVIESKHDTIDSFLPSPDGKLIGYTTTTGKFFTYNLKSNKRTLVTNSWDTPSFEWSPDSKWLTYSLSNNDFNSDIYIAPIDGSSKPLNVTRHPDNEYAPSFSPDGKKLAFIGKRDGTSLDLYYVDLTPVGSDKSARDKKLEMAKNAMKKDPTYNTVAAKLKSVFKNLTPGKSEETKPRTEPDPKIKSDPTDIEKKSPDSEEPKSKTTPTSKSKSKLEYDLTDIQNRIQHLPLKGITPSYVFWKKDSKAILVQSKQAKTTYAFDLKTKKPAKYLDATGYPIRYDKKGNLFWISNSMPSIVKNGKPTNYTFTAQTEFHPSQHQLYKFRLIWREIRDGFYDDTFNGNNWDDIRIKYEEAATLAVSTESFERIISMMLGELNASHTGYREIDTNTWKKRMPWKEEMLHLGLRHSAEKNGWRITNIFNNSPATANRSELNIGEIITHINDTKVDSTTMEKDVLWGQLKDPIQLKVINNKKEERDITIEPISYTKARSLASDDKIAENKAMVEKLSNANFGYLHIASMQWEEFKQFEKHLYENGADKDGLIIDVRDNGGGFTTDHLLTALTQPRHAYTIPRNGSLGYPQDRFVYATWQKPIVVLCNQNSFSNAEIFSHAIKTLKRGKLVGVPTAGGVISTGSANILKQGTLRMPFRGWFLSTTGEDMELNGASPEPENIVWPRPGELSAGIDKQIEKAIEVLADEVKSKPQKPITPKYRHRN